MEEHIIFNPEDVQKNKACGILAYFGILFIIPLFVAKDSPYARFHANQGLVLFIASTILSVITSTISNFLNIGDSIFHIAFNPAVLLATLISAAAGIVSIVFMIIGIVNACSGEGKKLPIIGNITLIK